MRTQPGKLVIMTVNRTVSIPGYGIMGPEPTVILRVPGIENIDRIDNTLTARIKVGKIDIELINRNIKRLFDQQVNDT